MLRKKEIKRESPEAFSPVCFSFIKRLLHLPNFVSFRSNICVWCSTFNLMCLLTYFSR